MANEFSGEDIEILNLLVFNSIRGLDSIVRFDDKNRGKILSLFSKQADQWERLANELDKSTRRQNYSLADTYEGRARMLRELIKKFK